MDGSTWWIYLLRPWFGIAYVFLLFLAVHWIARAIYRVFPSGRGKDYLFMGWQGSRASRSTKAEQRILDNAPLLRREGSKDSTRF